MLNGLKNRELGCKLKYIENLYSLEKLKSLKISDRNFERTFTASVNSVDVDHTESRYVLAGYSTGGIAIYDLHVPRSCRVINQVATINSGHKVSVDCVQWYPHDNGMFMSLSADQTLKVWDANELQVADEFKFNSDIFSFDYSKQSTKHSLIAVAGKDTSVYLCDLKSGSKSHILKGNQSPVFCVKWSPRNQNVVLSGSKDGSLIAWDIRKSKSLLHVFSITKSTLQHRNIAHRAAINGLTFTSDGLSLLSFGMDHQVRQWNMSSTQNIKVDYGRVENTCRRTVQISCSSNQLLFVPSGVSVKVLDLVSGTSYGDLKGHFRTVNGCYFNSDFKEMYSFSNDANIVLWDVLKEVSFDDSVYKDCWSDDESYWWKC